MSETWKRWAQDAAERAARTFLQFYFGFWLLRMGLLGTEADSSAASYDLLFTIDNMKAGVVGVALSLATALGAKPFGSGTDASFRKP